MKKIDLGQTINALANIGVIAGIAFLAIEINQNTKSAEVGAYQDLVAQIARLNELALEDAGPFALIKSDPDLSLSDLTPEEWEKVTSIALVIFRHGDMAFFQYEKGLLSEERLYSVLGPVRGSICTPVYQEVWQEFGGNFVQAYQEFVDTQISGCE